MKTSEKHPSARQKTNTKRTTNVPPHIYLVAAIAPRVEVRAQVDFQPTVAEMLNADLEVEGKLVQIEAKAVGLYQIPATERRQARGRADACKKIRFTKPNDKNPKRRKEKV